MATPNIGALRSVADRLDELQIPYAFVGGSIVNLLLDFPELSPARPTDDVDVVLEVATLASHSMRTSGHNCLEVNQSRGR
jgi:tRNA nucleotidyltransferase/poly(A) polymerase